MRQQARKREHAVHNKPSFESEYGSHRYAWIDRHTWIEIASTAAEVQHRVPRARVLQPLAENLAHEGLICRVPIIVSAGLAVCVRAGGGGCLPCVREWGRRAPAGGLHARAARSTASERCTLRGTWPLDGGRRRPSSRPWPAPGRRVAHPRSSVSVWPPQTPVREGRTGRGSVHSASRGPPRPCAFAHRASHRPRFCALALTNPWCGGYHCT